MVKQEKPVLWVSSIGQTPLNEYIRVLGISFDRLEYFNTKVKTIFTSAVDMLPQISAPPYTLIHNAANVVIMGSYVNFRGMHPPVGGPGLAAEETDVVCIVAIHTYWPVAAVTSI